MLRMEKFDITEVPGQVRAESLLESLDRTQIVNVSVTSYINNDMVYIYYVITYDDRKSKGVTTGA